MSVDDGGEGLNQTDEGAPEALAFRVALYVTPISTLILLNIVTLGFYSLFWFYRHWSVQKRAYKLKILPGVRGFFSIFFVHGLFRNIDRAARTSGLSPRWNPNSQATTYVGLVMASRFTGSLGPGEMADLVLRPKSNDRFA